MAADEKTLADLRKCMRDANGDAGKMALCEQAFVAAGGVVTPGVTPDQGKVFSIPDGNQAFVTNQGKVF
jgi:hypothetical protein